MSHFSRFLRLFVHRPLLITPFLILSGLTFGNISCTSQPKSWSKSMRGMSQAYEKLIPFMFSEKRFSDPKNKKFLDLYLGQLSNNASGLDKHVAKGLSGDDPLFSKGLKGLKQMVQRASESYYGENYEYSQKLLQSSIKYCSTCHMRTHRGPTFKRWDNFEDVTSNWSSKDYSQYLIATRQFDKATKVMEKGLESEQLSKKEAEFQLKNLVAVLLKNNLQPQRAMAVLKNKKVQKRFPSLKPKMKNWYKYLKANQKVDATVILNKASSTKMHFAQAVMVSRELHKNLSVYLDPLKRAKSFHLLGSIYQTHPELGFWNLAESYYEACIHELPGSKLATKCYYKIEQQQFTPNKSYGRVLNELEQKRLKVLKNIATQSHQLSPSSSSGGAGSEDD